MYTRRNTTMFKLLRTFESVYRTRSFTKSAEELYFSQPTVSKHIKWLEEMVGQELFIRQGANELLATRVGELVHETTSLILGEWSSLLEDVHSKGDGHPYYILGVSHSFASLYLAPMIHHLLKINEDINFNIRIINSSQVIDELKNNQINLGFIEKPIRTGMVNYHQLIDDELVLAGDLHSDLWLIREDDSGIRHYTEDYMQTRNIHEKVMKINSLTGITELLRTGVGKSILSKALVEDLPYSPLTGNFTRYFYLVEKEDDIQSRALVQQILAYFENISGPQRETK